MLPKVGDNTITSLTSHPYTGIDLPEGFTSIGKVQHIRESSILNNSCQETDLNQTDQTGPLMNG